jgi:hypothetical protein
MRTLAEERARRWWQRRPPLKTISRAAKFIDVLRSNTEDTGISKLLRGIDSELTGTSLHVHWVIPPEIVLDALKKRGPKQDAAPPPASSKPLDPRAKE